MRYLPHTPSDIAAMLAVIGAKSLDDLFVGIPRELRLRGPLSIPAPTPEPTLLRQMQQMAGEALPLSFLGAGAYRHYVPVLVDQQLLRSEWYTSYTPYQPEVSQGTLQAIFEFQTLIAELCGLDASNASLYDGSTAMVEAVVMAARLSSKERTRVVVAQTVHPEYRQVVNTSLRATEFRSVVVDHDVTGALDLQKVKEALDPKTMAVVIQQPNFLGHVEDVAAIATLAHDAGAVLVVMNNDPVAFGVLEAPGLQGADIVAGEGLPLTGHLSMGGPGFGFFACNNKNVRQMPGRIVGETTDSEGRRGYVLTLATREQHIRRERATSNICTNQGLMALAGTITLSLYGPNGLKDRAVQCMSKSRYLFSGLEKLGLERLTSGPYFHEAPFVVPNAPAVLAALEKAGVVLGYPLLKTGEAAWKDAVLCHAGDLHTRDDLDRALDAVSRALR
jgi:glycine dehydrogenase subunit 1